MLNYELQEHLNEIEEHKQAILDSLEELKSAVQRTDHHMAIAQFSSYVTGNVEQAMCDFGCGNICVESIVRMIEQDFEEEGEEE